MFFAYSYTWNISCVIQQLIAESSSFSFLGMVCRSQLAALDFKVGADLQLSGQENLSCSNLPKHGP